MRGAKLTERDEPYSEVIDSVGLQERAS